MVLCSDTDLSVSIVRLYNTKNSIKQNKPILYKFAFNRTIPNHIRQH